MGGLEAAIVRKSKVTEDLRIDAEYFKKRYLREDSALAVHDLHDIRSMAFVTDGPHGYHEVDEDSLVAMLTAKCANNWFAERRGADTVADWVVEKNRRSLLKTNDIILSTRGTVGKCALVTDEALPAIIDQDVARISLDKACEFLPQYLLAYINSQYGQDHIARNSSGMVQQGMSLEKVRSIPVPKLSYKLQEAVAAIVAEALKERRKSEVNQIAASEALLEKLGLANWTSPEPLTYTASSADAFASGRLDAQYFRPLFGAIEDKLNATGNAKELSSLLALNARGRQPVYSEEGLPVVNSKHVRTNRVLIDADNRTAIDQGASVIIEKGDVLINGTGVGTIGRAAPYLHDQKALPDNHVTVLRTSAVDPIYLAVFLNSPLGQWQIERHIKGSSGQIELYPNDIARIVVWDAPKPVQIEIRDAILATFANERRARELLEGAKRAVEIAIEDNEAAALAYLKSKRFLMPHFPRCSRPLGVV